MNTERTLLGLAEILTNSMHVVPLIKTIFSGSNWMWPVSRGFFIKFRVKELLTHFLSLVSFCTSWKPQKTRGFLMFSGGIKNSCIKWVNVTSNSCYICYNGKNIKYKKITDPKINVLVKSKCDFKTRFSTK